MKPIKISDGICITKTRQGSQCCIVCGKNIPKRTVAFSFHNYNDGLILKKNLWMHISCRADFKKILDIGIDKHGAEIFTEAI